MEHEASYGRAKMGVAKTRRCRICIEGDGLFHTQEGKVLVEGENGVVEGVKRLGARDYVLMYNG